ncbi:MAG: hypothetical protein JW744_01495 [Candidatus Diapherotrites archaeon]|uniref:Lipoate--protein ligase n=1 Tax=Candidatus Iainarchaeum sp. TaxID=3101447 RepID=A0A938YWT7_9ARCH|nr:hypothetical protein [Candidatus Diapherotrites archaeon]
MISCFDYKVPNGKLVRVRAEFQGELVLALKITGDFFMHPEHGIELVEAAAKGKTLEELQGAIERAVEENSITLFGVSPEAIAHAVKMASGQSGQV